MRLRINFGALKKIKNKIKGEFGDHADASDLVDDIVRAAGQRCLSKTIKRTPVDTGQLRKNWEMHEPVKRGFNHTVDIENPVEYATCVEFGHRIRHRQTVGRYVPQIGKRLVRPYVEGKYIKPVYMAMKSVEEIKEELPDIAEERMIKKFLEIFP